MHGLKKPDLRIDNLLPLEAANELQPQSVLELQISSLNI